MEFWQVIACGLIVNLIWQILSSIANGVDKSLVKLIKSTYLSRLKVKRASIICFVSAVIIFILGAWYLIISDYSDLVKSLIGIAVWVIGSFLFAFHNIFSKWISLRDGAAYKSEESPNQTSAEKL